MSTIMEIEEIQKLLPHRYPFLLVDRVIDIKEGESIRAIKNVTINEPFFQGHFPHQPIMPGVLQVEAMAQVAGIYALKINNIENSSVYFLSIDNAKFRHPVVPGDQLIIHITILSCKSNRIRFEGKITVNDKVVSEATMFAMVKA